MNEQLRSLFHEYKRELIRRDFGRMNPMQFEAVTAVNGPLLVLAGAGSGKTTVLVSRIANLMKYGDAYRAESSLVIEPEDVALLKACLDGDTSQEDRAARLICERPVKGWQIMAITFTNKAAGELKERIEDLIGEQARDIWASTFHSACARILRRYADRLGYAANFTIYDSDDSRRVMKECLKSLNIDEKMLPHRAVLSEISRAKDELLSPREYSNSAGDDYKKKKTAEAYIQYERRLKEAGAMDFDDLIFGTVKLFREHEDVLDYYQEKFRYILVDEYQDTNHAQYMLVKMLAEKHKNLCVVGDDDQSIYRFRGATIENILNFEREYPDAKVIRLEQNYRSTTCILDAANAVIGNNRGRKGKNLWTDNTEGVKIRQHTAQDEQQEARFVADTVLELAEDGGKFSDCAVLYRMNALSGTVENVFARSGIPYKIIGGFKFYDRKEIKDVLAYLSVICNPDDALRLRRIINEPKRGIGDTTVARAAEIAEGLGMPLFEVLKTADEYEPLARAAAKLKKFTAMIEDLIRLSGELPMHELVELTLNKSGYLLSLQTGEKSAERTENVREFLSGILKYEQENENADLAGFLEEISLITDIDSYDPDADRVMLMTMHAAKGLEFKNVFLVGMEEGIFPGNQSIYAGEEEMEEERRLAYVGITRAKSRLYLLGASSRMGFMDWAFRAPHSGRSSRKRVHFFMVVRVICG